MFMNGIASRYHLKETGRYRKTSLSMFLQCCWNLGTARLYDSAGKRAFNQMEYNKLMLENVSRVHVRMCTEILKMSVLNESIASGILITPLSNPDKFTWGAGRYIFPDDEDAQGEP